MQQSVGQRPVTSSAAVGLLLIVAGCAVLIGRAAGLDLFGAIGPWGWPLFIIVPGVVLLAASLIPARPNGIGFATAGAVVTTVGLLLAYQWRTGHWESWAYAWALLPGAAGLAQLAYGLFAREREMIRRGIWMMAVAAVLFTVGAWFFEGVFAGEPRPLGVDWGPVGLIVIGAIVLAGAFLGPSEADAASPGAVPPAIPVPPASSRIPATDGAVPPPPTQGTPAEPSRPG